MHKYIYMCTLENSSAFWFMSILYSYLQREIFEEQMPILHAVVMLLWSINDLIGEKNTCGSHLL